MRTWEGRDPAFGRPIAAPLEQCAELLGIDLAKVCEVAANVEPYIRADGKRVWSLMQLERQLRPEVSGDGAATSTVEAVRLPIRRLNEGRTLLGHDVRRSGLPRASELGETAMRTCAFLAHRAPTAAK